ARTTATETDNYLTDALGSTVELTNSAGALEAQYSYGPYGDDMSITGSTTNSYTYTGRETDGLDINYYRARYYNPATGRFISEDPAGFAGSGPNLYAYAYDSPLVFVDPSGLTVTCSYEINSGALVCFDDDSGQEVVNTSGYSGGNEGLNPYGVNNPAFESPPDVGPIPEGSYSIGPDNQHMGPYSLPLTPFPGSNLFRRGWHDFYIHGDNSSKPPQSSSKGCVVTNHNARKTINDAGGGTLNVWNSNSPSSWGVCVGGFCSL
ncbi:MAG: RHS repeat-associated core domain-containing protein, partial [Terracidiphilus sp.]